MKLEIDTDAQIITVAGLKLHLDVLKMLACPDTSKYYQFKRKPTAYGDDVCIVTQFLKEPA